jgi:prevent-host-death family protein
MVRTIAQRELRNDNAQVIDAVVSGETFVVTRHGVPVAELRPIQNPRRTFVPRSDLLALVASGPHIDFGQFRSDLDGFVDQSL